MTAAPPPGALPQLSSQVLRSHERLVRLEGDASEAEVVLKRSTLRQEELYGSLEGAFAILEEELESLRAEVESFAKESGKVMLRFRDLVKRDQLEESSRRLQQWPLESYVSRSSFVRMIAERLR